MKLATLLAQFLYTHKRMELPGIGIFQLDESVNISPENNKPGKPVMLEGVSFESKPSIKESPELIQYISSQTGKIKPLAAADLESHLGLAQQFLNIGKPFLLEGIGSLVKLGSGHFTFTSGQMLHVNTKDYSERESTSSDDSDYKSIFYLKKAKTKWKKPIAVFLLLAGLAVAIWGGYAVYKKTTAKKDNDVVKENKKDEINDKQEAVQPQTVVANNDTAVNKVPVTFTPAITASQGNYKFVLENATAQRAFSRFARLKTFEWQVQMETKDSVTYKLFMILPATVQDTARMIDSLSGVNGRKVYIEQ